MELKMFEEGVHYTAQHVMAQIVEHDGKFAGGILMVRQDDDTSWGEIRQSWLWAVFGADGNLLGRSENTWTALKSGCDANPHPVKMLGSILHYMAAGVEARNNPDSENYGIFPAEVTEWAYMVDSELAELDFAITTAEESGVLEAWPASS